MEGGEGEMGIMETGEAKSPPLVLLFGVLALHWDGNFAKAPGWRWMEMDGQKVCRRASGMVGWPRGFGIGAFNVFCAF